MQKNWYIIYTKPKMEKKVLGALKKRKLEIFFPVNCTQISSYRKIKNHEEPLFPSYIFARLADTDIPGLRSVDGVVNLVYWKGKPAVIQDDEIEIIKEFITDHQNIKLEKTKVNQNDVARVIDGSRYSVSGNVLTVKNTVVKVNLPSIGFTLVAKVDANNPLHTEVPFGEKDLLYQS